MIRTVFLLRVTLGLFLAVLGADSPTSAAIEVDCDYPGGNIIVDRIEGDQIYVRQDLRDTRGDWFYWNFRVKGAAGRAVTVHFTGSNVIGVRGPAVSRDGGKSWQWLGADAVRDKSFRFEAGPDDLDVRFCFAMPYLQSNLATFLERHRGNPQLKVDRLAISRRGRDVERLHLGNWNGQPKHRVLITCRHHCCEMMASYSLEGLMAAVLADSEEGGWLREHVEFLVIPFMDKDGVEDGDQGKNRRPRDHNRDYAGESIHPEVKSLREFVASWSEGRLHFALDVHDPWIRGNYNEIIYFVENEGPAMNGVRRFAGILESVQEGPLPFRAKDNLPFGQAWNTAANYRDGMSFARWAGSQPGIQFAATVEIPYANVSGEPVTAASAREFGRDLALALRKFLDSE